MIATLTSPESKNRTLAGVRLEFLQTRFSNVADATFVPRETADFKAEASFRTNRNEVQSRDRPAF